MTIMPKLVVALTTNHGAWIVGSAADPDKEKVRDIDVLVPFTHWASASHHIPRNAKPNTFGGFKCVSDGVTVDVWPGDLDVLMLHPKAKYAYHPLTGTLIGKSDKKPNATVMAEKTYS